MKINVVNTVMGFVPALDEDSEKKRKMKIGAIYEVSIKLKRNYEFHKKYFALIRCAWEYQLERSVEHFKNDIELFRKTVEIAAGHCEVVYSIKRREWLEVPKSIAFDAMSEDEFQNLYERVKDVLYVYFLKHVTPEEFEGNLQFF